jgi:AraC-like DNA-binding protein
MDETPKTPNTTQPGTTIPFVRANAFYPFISFLDSIGAPTEAYLGRVRIPEPMLEDPEGLVPIFPAYRFLEMVAEKEGTEGIGTVVGQTASAFDLGAFGSALQGASTVYDYLLTGIRLIGSHSSNTRLWLKTEKEHLRFNQYLKGPTGPGRCIADIYTLVITISMLRRFIGAHWSPGEVCLLDGDEAVLGEWDVFGETKVITRQRHSSFTISRSLLHLRVPDDHPDSAAGNGSLMTMSRPIPTGFLGSVEQLITSYLLEGYPDIETTAEAAGISSRTLQRRLAENGVTYTSMVAESRFRLATGMLLETSIPIAEIADMLGYKDVSNFSRAFRRRVGMSPKAFRSSRTLTPSE